MSDRIPIGIGPSHEAECAARQKQNRLAFNKVERIIYIGICERVLAITEISPEVRAAATGLLTIMKAKPNGDWGEEEIYHHYQVLMSHGYLPEQNHQDMSYEQAAAIMQQGMPDEAVNQHPESPAAATRAAERPAFKQVFQGARGRVLN